MLEKWKHEMSPSQEAPERKFPGSSKPPSRKPKLEPIQRKPRMAPFPRVPKPLNP